MVHNAALVVGFDGASGNAWEIGIIAGLSESGLEITEAADRVVGTQAGATAAAQVLSGMSAAQLLAQVRSPPVHPVGQNRDRRPSLPMAAGFERMRTQALTLPDWNGPETWIYSDLIPGHQSTYSGLLVAVIECDGTCSGEPSEDLTAVWMVLPAHYRPAFRAALAVDDSTWLRS